MYIFNIFNNLFFIQFFYYENMNILSVTYTFNKSLKFKLLLLSIFEDISFHFKVNI